jgi:hemerythrin-like domain-containing protein
MTAPEISQRLHAEHLRTLDVLARLDERIMGPGKARPLDPADAADRTLVADLQRMLAEDIDRHYRFEEEHLFPHLAAAGFADMTRMLADEHASVRGFAAGLADLAAVAATARLDAAAWSTFRDLAMDLANSATFHIQKEEMGVIRSLPAILDSAAAADLARRYAEG